MTRHTLYILFFLISLSGLAGNKLRLEKANKLKGTTYKGQKVNKVIGDVVFKQNDVTMYCDSAFQYMKKDYIEAFGHVKIYQGNKTKLFGDSLKYDGLMKYAIMYGDVRMEDQNMTLVTTKVEYDTKNKIAHYNQEGTITNKDTKLISQSGHYLSRLSTYHFIDSVTLTKDDYTLTSDTLHYNVNTHLATFFGPTTITAKDKYLFAEKGNYNTETEISIFTEKAFIKAKEYTIKGDSLYYENKTEIGYAEGNVELSTIKDSLLIQGGIAERDGIKGISKVFNNPVMTKMMNGDTLLLMADTLISYDDTLDLDDHLLAFNNVKIFKNDLQAICDSLAYMMSDSAIYFYTNPVLWNDLNQISGDSIYITLKNNEIDKMYADINSFLISHDTLNDFNQTKGRNMIAHFAKGEIEHVNINGNGQTIYYARNNEGQLIGLNYIECSDMVILFEKNELKHINFLDRPDSKFIPPHEIKKPEKTLKKFQWEIDQKPKKKDFTKIQNI